MIPTPGRIVAYTLTEYDAFAINKRRTDATASAVAGQNTGAVVHVGNHVSEGDVFPLVITRANGDTVESTVNGQVLLDGTDTLWVTSRGQGEGPSRWCEPPRVHTAAAQPSGAQS